MTRPKLTAQEFAEEINRRIQLHSGFLPCQAVAPVHVNPPPVPGEIRDVGLGRHWMGNVTPEQAAVFDAVEAEIRVQFDVEEYRP